jgi:hypothetical protein
MKNKVIVLFLLFFTQVYSVSPNIGAQIINILNQRQDYILKQDYSLIYSNLISSVDKNNISLNEFIKERVNYHGDLDEITTKFLTKTKFSIKKVDEKAKIFYVEAIIPDLINSIGDIDYSKDNYQKQIDRMHLLILNQSIVPTISQTISGNYVIENKNAKLYIGYKEEKDLQVKALQEEKDFQIKALQEEKEAAEKLKKHNDSIVKIRADMSVYLLNFEYVNALSFADKNLDFFDKKYLIDEIIYPIVNNVYGNMKNNPIQSVLMYNTLKKSVVYATYKSAFELKLIKDDYFKYNTIEKFEKYIENNQKFQIDSFDLEVITESYSKKVKLTLHIKNTGKQLIKGWKVYAQIRNNMGMELYKGQLYSDTANLLPKSKINLKNFEKLLDHYSEDEIIKFIEKLKTNDIINSDGYLAREVTQNLTALLSSRPTVNFDVMLNSLNDFYSEHEIIKILEELTQKNYIDKNGFLTEKFDATDPSFKLGLKSSYTRISDIGTWISHEDIIIDLLIGIFNSSPPVNDAKTIIKILNDGLNNTQTAVFVFDEYSDTFEKLAYKSADYLKFLYNVEEIVID